MPLSPSPGARSRSRASYVSAFQAPPPTPPPEYAPPRTPAAVDHSGQVINIAARVALPKSSSSPNLMPLPPLETLFGGKSGGGGAAGIAFLTVTRVGAGPASFSRGSGFVVARTAGYDGGRDGRWGDELACGL